MFNTGTVVGVSANIFGAGFPRNFIPSYSWGGGSAAYETYNLKKAFATMERVLERRQMKLTEQDREIFQHIYDTTARFRSWEGLNFKAKTVETV
jgi:hypothetical protein